MKDKFSIPYRVRLADTDAAGVVYFAHLLAMCHTAYEEVLVNLGIDLPKWVRQGTIAIPIIHGEIDCLRPIFWGDLVIITLTPQLVSDNEFVIAYQFTSETEPDRILAKGKTQHVCINPQTRQRQPLPQEMTTGLIRDSQHRGECNPEIG